MPHAAIFGKKDYQQYLVLRDMVRQFALPIEIIPAETVRAADGLALSSRNGYLTAAERAEAPRLYALLRSARESIAKGERNFQRIELEAMSLLSQNGWAPQYVSVRRRADLQAPAPEEQGTGGARRRLSRQDAAHRQHRSNPVAPISARIRT